MMKIPKSSTHSLGQWVILVFVITQHQRDQQLLFCIVKNLGCGKVYKKGEGLYYRVFKLSDITEKIIPFFPSCKTFKGLAGRKKYPILEVKALDFKDFCLKLRSWWIKNIWRKKDLSKFVRSKQEWTQVEN